MNSFALISRAALFSFILLISSCDSLQDSSLAPGRSAPNLNVLTLQGEKKTLADYEGKVTVLNFLTSWCKPCEEEMPSLIRLQEKMKGKVNVVAIGVEDDDSALKDFYDRNHLTFPLLHDPSGQAKQRYRLAGYPETFILDPKGDLLLVPDPESGNEPKLKLIGPRAWDSPQMIAMLGMLAEASQ